MKLDYKVFTDMFFSDSITDYRSDYFIMCIDVKSNIDIGHLIPYLYTSKKIEDEEIVYFVFIERDDKKEFIEKVTSFLKGVEIKYAISIVPYDKYFNKKELLYALLKENEVVKFDGNIHNL